MSPQQLERVKEMLDEVLGLDRVERAAYLAAADVDETVRHEVESLLAQEDIEVPLLGGPIFPRVSSGQRIGPYRILRRLGDGGMGTVVLAMREDFKKKVALKLIRPGLISGEALRRFLSEAQMLAQVEHPNVARILDGGTTDDGHPYFVMEYVKGEPIDEYCRGLSIVARVELFRQVCAAVQMAHSHLIVHRDLKPGNILVTAEGTAKLLDFGIAKQLAPSDSEAASTTLHSQPMTLLYASPEQIEGRRIRPASDIYSLGVLLYQLLTGLLPYEGNPKSLSEVTRAIREEEPRRPSTAVRQDAEQAGRKGSRRRQKELTGDLDSIVLKALEKDPRQRYGSVEQLSEDLRRHLTALPVSARRATFLYRAWKLVRRRKLPLAAVAAALALAAFATLQWRLAVSERERREVVVEVMSELFWVPILKEARGQERRVQKILESSLDKVDLLEAEPPLQAEILQAAAVTYAELGDEERTLELRERAVRILRDHYGGKKHPDLARAINNLATSYYRLQRTEDAERLYREALAMKESLSLDDEDRAKSLSNLASILTNRGELAEAEPLYREALSIREKTYTPGQVDLATSLRSLANLRHLRGEPAEAEPLLRRALEIRRDVYGTDSKAFAAVLSTLGRVVHAQGRAAEAEELFRQTLEIRRRRYGEASRAVAATGIDLAAVHLDRGEVDVAEELLVEALEILRAKAPEHWQLPRAESLLGAVRTAQGRYGEAEPLLLGGVRKLGELRGEVVYTRNARRRLREFEDVQDAGSQALP